jgi:hypothetical protein
MRGRQTLLIASRSFASRDLSELTSSPFRRSISATSMAANRRSTKRVGHSRGGKTQTVAQKGKKAQNAEKENVKPKRRANKRSQREEAPPVEADEEEPSEDEESEQPDPSEDDEEFSSPCTARPSGAFAGLSKPPEQCSREELISVSTLAPQKHLLMSFPWPFRLIEQGKQPKTPRKLPLQRKSES